MKSRGCGVVVLAVVLVLGAGACRGGSAPGGEDGDDGVGEEVDPRCEALCEEESAECVDAVASCRDICQARVEGVESLCATCLLDGARGGDCAPGVTCCPDPTFGSVLDCVDACAGSSGAVPPGEHPVCADLCADSEPECAEAVDSCFSECRARVEGVSGLCATCLLEDAHGGDCAPGMICCPAPTFPTSAADCAPVCGD